MKTIVKVRKLVEIEYSLSVECSSDKVIKPVEEYFEKHAYSPYSVKEEKDRLASKVFKYTKADHVEFPKTQMIVKEFGYSIMEE